MHGGNGSQNFRNGLETIDMTPCPSALEDGEMRDVSTSNNQPVVAPAPKAEAGELQLAREQLEPLDARARLLWAYEQFGSGFVVADAFIKERAT